MNSSIGAVFIVSGAIDCPIRWMKLVPKSVRNFVRLQLGAPAGVLLCSTVRALPSNLEISQLYHTQWTVLDGAPTGIEALAQTLDGYLSIRAEFPDARVVVMSALQSGACGYLLKDMMRKELRDTIRAVHAGKRVIPAGVAMGLAEFADGNALSSREVEVLRSVARGNSNHEVAIELRITEDTVKAHMKSILKKLDAKDRTHAVMLALKRGILQV